MTDERLAQQLILLADPAYVHAYLARRAAFLSAARADPAQLPPVAPLANLPSSAAFAQVEEAVLMHLLRKGVARGYIEDYLQRTRLRWVSAIDQVRYGREIPPEALTTATRTRANLEAIAILRALAQAPRALTVGERQAVLRYSGWGGLSINRVRSQVPQDLDDAGQLLWLPDAAGLLHEYYTPSRLCQEVARVVQPLLAELAAEDGIVRALEPSAGIGRFPSALSGAGFERLRWTLVEYSPLSARILAALFPAADLYAPMPFERFISEHEQEVAGSLSLVVSNPPYGERGPSSVEDRSPRYRGEQNAYQYFLRRTADLLRAGGLGIYLIPYGFLTGQGRSLPRLRETVFRRHHLAAAFRLPSNLFPGGNIVTDLVFLRSRGGEIAEILPEDRPIAAGEYFNLFPAHILGREIRKDDGNEVKGARRGYEVLGDFDVLPALIEREQCRDCQVRTVTPAPAPRRRSSVAVPAEPTIEVGEDRLAAAQVLGERISRFLAARNHGEGGDRAEAAVAAGLYGELVAALRTWSFTYGPPAQDAELAQQRSASMLAFHAAFQPDGSLGPAFAEAPVYVAAYQGSAEDVGAQGEHLYRRGGAFTLVQLLALHREVGGTSDGAALTSALLAAGFVLDDGFFVPERDFYTGDLWPRYDRARALAQAGDERAAQVAARILTAIKPATIADIAPGPRSAFLPLPVLRAWLSSWTGSPVPELARRKGLLQVADQSYAELSLPVRAQAAHDTAEAAQERRAWHRREAVAPLASEHEASLKLVVALGFLNHDYSLFRVPCEKGKRSDGTDESAQEAQDRCRVKYAQDAENHFSAWLQGAPDQSAQIEEQYNRSFRGFVLPTYSQEPIPIARMDTRRKRPRPHQWAGALRLLTNRRGLLCFDVGVGKTLTAIATVARAREEGWCKRPIILVPNTIVWKWKKEIGDVLPDYRVVVIGSKLKRISRGPKKGQMTSDIDTREERAMKWRLLQQGLCDVALVTYSMFSRLGVRRESVEAWIDSTPAIQRDLCLKARNAEDATRRSQQSIEDAEEPVRPLFRQRAGIVAELKAAGLSTSTALEEVEALILATGTASRRILEREQYREAIGTLEDLSERNQAVQAQIQARLVAEMTLGERDPGVTWEDVDPDLIVVDEAQNFKNLFAAQEREGGLPKYLGAIQEGSDRAWELAIRTGILRRRNGGGGVMFLSATPAKNSPIEYRSLLHYVDEDSWVALGCYDAECFIDRYLRLEYKETFNQVEERTENRQVVAGFQQLAELRELVFRLAEFRTAQEVGLQLPESRVIREMLDMSERQREVYKGYRLSAMDLKRRMATDKAARLQLLGVLHKMALASIHPLLPTPPGSQERELDAGRSSVEEGDAQPKKKRKPWTWEAAGEIPLADCHAPKLDRVVQLVRQRPSCGHIIFCDNIAVHRWMQRLLMEAGVPEERIGILNADRAKKPAERQAIADGFNGDAEGGILPRYDVVIANAIAYEGIDLQVRTCAVYHLDLPYEPATLQQRNGRAVRQGNKSAVIEIFYLLSRKSSDVIRLQMIEGKLAWQTDLLRSSDRETSNPFAQADQTSDELIAQLAETEEEAAQAIAAQRERRLAEVNSRIADGAWRVLKGLGAQVDALARAREDAERAVRHKEIADSRAYLAAIEPAVWPWFRLVEVVAAGRRLWTHRILEGEQKRPETVCLWDGARYHPGDAAGSSFEVAEVNGLNVRPVGRLCFVPNRLRSDNGVLELLHDHFAPDDFTSWPEDRDDAGVRQELADWCNGYVMGSRSLEELGISTAPEPWRQRLWQGHSPAILQALARARSSPYLAFVPVRQGEGLDLVEVGRQLLAAGRGLAGRESQVLPFTQAGYEEFLERARRTEGSTWGVLDETARVWWGRAIPRGLLVVEEAPAEPAPAAAPPVSP